MEAGIKNLLIDFGGVLIDLDRPRCVAAFERLGLTHIAQVLDTCHQQGFFLQHERGLLDDAAFRDRIRQEIGRSDVTDADIDQAWNSFLVGIPTAKLELLLRLRGRYRTYLLSNTNDLHWQWSCRHAFAWNGHRAEDFFDDIFLSYKLKMSKPDADIFAHVLDVTGIDPRETLFIDDSEANCRTARTFGIHTYTPQAHEDWGHLFD